MNKELQFEECTELSLEYTKRRGLSKHCDLGRLLTLNTLLANVSVDGVPAKGSLKAILQDFDFVRMNTSLAYIAKQFNLEIVRVLEWHDQLTAIRNEIFESLANIDGKAFGAIRLQNAARFIEAITEDPGEILKQNDKGQTVLEYLHGKRYYDIPFYNSLMAFVKSRFQIPDVLFSPNDINIWTKFIEAQLAVDKLPPAVPAVASQCPLLAAGQCSTCIH